MAEVSETKIQMTKRLQRDGRWDVASQFRCDERRRLRASGMPRDEANETAWELMGERYPSAEDKPAYYLAAAKHPPENCGSPEFADVWFVFIIVQAYIGVPDASEGAEILDHALENAPSESAHGVLDGDWLDYLDVVETTLTQEIERREKEPNEINNQVARQLAHHVDQLPGLRAWFTPKSN